MINKSLIYTKITYKFRFYDQSFSYSKYTNYSFSSITTDGKGHWILGKKLIKKGSFSHLSFSPDFDIGH